jgi:hypothetical protein
MLCYETKVTVGQPYNIVLFSKEPKLYLNSIDIVETKWDDSFLWDTFHFIFNDSAPNEMYPKEMNLK